MKNKKLIIIISSIVAFIALVVVLILLFNNKGNNANNSGNNKNNSEPKTLLEAVLKKNNKEEGYYKKITDEGILNTDTTFRNYAFISNNTIYIYNPNKLDKGEFIYKKVYDIGDSIKAMNILPDHGSDIRFIDYNDTLYTLHDNNTDNKVRDSYDMYLHADYKLSDYLKWEYSKEYLGNKLAYDFISSTSYFKDNVLYSLTYTSDSRYPIADKINGNYEGEKLIRIYNSKLLKTDKGYYEIIKYFDSNLNKTVYTTMKIKLLSEYYDEVLTFTYKYVILKDLTIIPINDVMDRFHDYQYNEYIGGPNYESEIPKVFEE